MCLIAARRRCLTDLLGGQVNVAMDFMPPHLPPVATASPRAGGDDEPARRATARCADRAGGGTPRDFRRPRGTRSHLTGTPPDIVSKVTTRRMPSSGAQGQDYPRQNALQGVGGPPDDLNRFIHGERAKLGPVIEAAKITM